MGKMAAQEKHYARCPPGPPRGRSPCATSASARRNAPPALPVVTSSAGSASRAGVQSRPLAHFAELRHSRSSCFRCATMRFRHLAADAERVFVGDCSKFAFVHQLFLNIAWNKAQCYVARGMTL
mmetsp:Transcript_67491/g.141057  ORF Transcript_67491/g.141057 Transcript_67491/m.141057 type:complete len:124 (+) Transcript_67491:792-1163(+)